MTVTIEAQWALYGSRADTAGFRVLSCSTGRLNRDNFSEAIGRFSLGTPDTLPQVTVSYVASGEGDNYIALAIHKFAGDDGEVRPDETVRRLVSTSYFCVPYLSLANAALGYLPLYQALHSIKLPPQAGRPLQVGLTAADPATPTAAVSALAKQVAALLTTGSPVCVLGASSTSVTERLRFIDAVMALLPYGSHTRMTAATWVRPTHRDHRFRLCFSDASRDHDPPDHMVWWGSPEQTALTPEHGSAYEYQRFLDDEARQSGASLINQTLPHGFKRDELRAMLVDLGVTAPRPIPARLDLQKPPQPETTAADESDPDEKILADCAAHAEALNLPLLMTDIPRLRRLGASTGLSDGQRARYRELIAGHGLLEHNPALGRLEARLYDALLPLAFGKPLSYEGYCQVEDCSGGPPGEPPNTALLQAIERCGMADPPVIAIVLTQLGAKQKLRTEFASSRFSADKLIDQLAGRWERPQHFRIACDVTLDYLTVARSRYEPAAVRGTLRRHGFLAQALLDSGCPDQYQVHALYRLLQAAYPDKLGRTAVTAVLHANPQGPVTPALFAAVLFRLARLEDAQLARDAYATASLTGLAFDPETKSRVERLLPVLDQTSGNVLATRMSQPVAGRSSAVDDVPEPGT
jgi:hypothetical protein